jgi:ATP-dependent Clp protease ATP-binding subunit ClpC
MILQPTGDTSELTLLSHYLDEIRGTIQSDTWLNRKQGLFAEMETPDFWSSPRRHSVLETLETIDRIEKSLERAEGLRRRLDGLASRRTRPTRLIAILAQSLYLLSVASRDIDEGNPQDAFLVVEVKAVVPSDADKHLQFAHRIADMYEAWADRRNMRLARLQRTRPRDVSTMRAIYGISGYGAHSILSPETGLHVLEIAGDASNAKRLPVRVVVAPQPDAPLPPDPDEAARLAEQAIEKTGEPGSKIVRRYREGPSPLVRDSNRGWRTGRIELVLGGDFDLL